MNARLRPLTCWLFAFFAAAPVAGQDTSSAAAPPRLSFRHDTQWIGAAVGVSPADTWINRGGQAPGVPQATWLGELRLNARIEAGSRLQLVLRPRVRGSIETTSADARPTERRGYATFEMTEAYLTWRPADAVAITYGLQNFQWGPAEMMAPSNRLFHEIGVFRDALYSPRGKHLVRMNISRGRQWSFVALGEIGATGEGPLRAGAAFRRAGQAKLEYTTPSGAAYVGLTGGARGGEPPWLGGYAAVTMTDRLSAYVDASVQRGSQAWYPVSPGAGDAPVAFEASARSSGRRTLALAGLRCTLSAAFDARLEYLRQDAGYSRAQIAAAPLAVARHLSPEAVERWTAPGIEFLARDLVLASVLARDIGPAGRLDLHGRYVRSLTDGSGAGFITASVDASDALVVFGSLTLTHGPELAEFTRLARAGGVAGFIWSW